MSILKAQPMVIPAVVFAARVRLGQGALTEIERVALEAIGHGVAQVDVLTELLGLGARPTLDLIYDLWRQGYLLVRSGRAQVQLAGQARVRFADGRLAELGSAERNIRPVRLIQELLTGAVLPPVGRDRPEGPDSGLVPTPMVGLDLGRVSRVELESAVKRALEQEGHRGAHGSEPRKLQILETWLEPEQLLQSPSSELPDLQGRRYLTVLADVQLDPDTRRMRFDLVHAPDLPPTLRRAVGEELSERAQVDAGLLFYKRLREELSRRPDGETEPHPLGAVKRLVAEVRRLDRVDPGTVEQRHSRLREVLFEAVDELNGANHAQGQASLIVGYADHDTALRALVAATTRQLVLINPWISLDGLVDSSRGASWLHLLEQALHRGVRVVVLWGIAEDSTLPREVGTAMEDLRVRFPGLILCSRRSSNLHAKVAVRDAAEAIVTSYNFLQPPRTGDSLELGLRLVGEPEGRSPGAVQVLLAWAAQRYPEHQRRREIATLPEDLGGERAPPLPELSPPERPDVGPEVPDPEMRALALRLWAEQWGAVARKVQQTADQLGDGVALLQGEAHRSALWEALREGGQRLVVLSDKISVDVVTDRFARAVRERLDAQVPCVFVYRTEGVADHAEGPAARLEALSRAAPGLCRLVPTRSHAKLLIQDDRLVLGSYNFLSFGADERGPSRGAERGELSLRVQSSALVDHVLEVLDRLAPGSCADLRGRSEGTSAASLEALPTSLQPLLRALNDTRAGVEPLRRWFERSSTPWADLDALDRAGAAHELLRRAALAGLAFSEHLEAAGRARWQARAALWRWQEGDLIGAAVLLPDPAPDGSPLPSWLANLGAAVEAESQLPRLSPTRPTADQAAAALLLVLCAALRQGCWQDLDALLEGFGDPAPPASVWVEAVNEWRRRAQGEPLNMRLLQRGAEETTRRREAQEARLALLHTLDAAVHVGFTFPLGQHTWDLLCSEGHLLGELQRAAQDDDAHRLERFFQANGRSTDVPERLMDEASLERRDQHGNRRIDDPKRRTCLTRLGRAWQQGLAWVELALKTTQTAEEARHLAAARTLGQALRPLGSPDLYRGAPLAESALVFVRGRLHPLLALEPQ